MESLSELESLSVLESASWRRRRRRCPLALGWRWRWGCGHRLADHESPNAGANSWRAEDHRRLGVRWRPRHPIQTDSLPRSDKNFLIMNAAVLRPGRYRPTETHPSLCIRLLKRFHCRWSRAVAVTSRVELMPEESSSVLTRDRRNDNPTRFVPGSSRAV